MTDIINNSAPSPETRQGKNAIRLQQSAPLLVELVELLFFAYRDFTDDPDAILKEIGLGRAHHRVLHFVNRYPGLRVADLLDILKITKQSLAKVLKKLVGKGLIEQRPGKSDRRERRLFATSDGRELAHRLMEPQLARIKKALQISGIESEQISRNFLYNMINLEERKAVKELFSHSPTKRTPVAISSKDEKQSKG